MAYLSLLLKHSIVESSRDKFRVVLYIRGGFDVADVVRLVRLLLGEKLK